MGTMHAVPTIEVGAAEPDEGTAEPIGQSSDGPPAQNGTPVGAATNGATR
jgi:hypothetical protein